MTVEELLKMKIDPPSREIFKASCGKWDLIAKPIDGLGGFEETVSRIAAIQDNVIPELSKKALIIMCSDNGVVEEGVSQTGQEVTKDVARLMGKKRSSVGIMTKDYPLDHFVFDVGINTDEKIEGVIDAKVHRGTKNFVKVPAMTEEECLNAIKTGIDAAQKCSDNGYGIIATGEMGIGNTTTSTALFCALKGLDPKEVTGRGAGLSDSGLQKKIQTIEKGLKLHTGEKNGRKTVSKEKVFEVLRCLGGADIAGLTGVFIGGARFHIPVVIDGFISAAAALTAERLLPGCREFMIASHLGRERGMKLILEELGLKAVIHADLALGEGTGAVLLFPMLDMVMNLYREGTDFGDTDIEQYERFEG